MILGFGTKFVSIFPQCNASIEYFLQGTLKATVDPKSSYHPEPLLMNLGVFGVSSAPKSVTVNDHPIESFSYSASTKVIY